MRSFVENLSLEQRQALVRALELARAG